MPEVAAELGITYLNDSSKEIDGMLFVGAALWTRTSWSGRRIVPICAEAVRTATKMMNDYRAIKVAPGRSKDMLRPAQTIAAHKESVAYIGGEDAGGTPRRSGSRRLYSHVSVASQPAAVARALRTRPLLLQ